MKLCSNRPDGAFGPYYDGNGVHVLTSCFDEVLLEPLGPFIFILFTLILFAVMWRRRSTLAHNYIHNSEALPLSSDREYPDHTNPSESQLPKSAVRHSTIRRILAPSGGKVGSGYWPKTRLTLFILASFFLIALLAMHALEIARLSANKQGIGLLPATLVPLVIVYISLFLPTPAWSRGGWRKPARPHGLAWISGIVCWSLWMIITIGVKMWSFSRVYNEIGVEAYDGVGSKYPYSDKIIDNIVICAVYFCFLACYLHNTYLEYIRYEWAWFA